MIRRRRSDWDSEIELSRHGGLRWSSWMEQSVAEPARMTQAFPVLEGVGVGVEDKAKTAR